MKSNYVHAANRFSLKTDYQLKAKFIQEPT